MTDIYLDDSKVEFEDTEHDTTVEKLVFVLEEQLREHRRFICALSLDGDEFDSWRDDPVSKRLILEFNELKLTSATVERIVLEGVDVLENYLRVVLENIDKCVDGVRLGGASVDVSVVVIVDGMTEIVKTMHELFSGGKKFDISIFRQDPSAYYKSILDCLETVKEARDSTDNVLLADVLEYELKPLVEEILKSLFFDKSS